MRKLDFLFIFLAVLLSADYLTSVIGINWLEEQNQLVVQIYMLVGNWFVTFTLLYLLKLASLVGIYELERFFRWKHAEFEAVRRAARAIAAMFLLVLYFVIVVNNTVLIASAEDICEYSTTETITYFQNSVGTGSLTYVSNTNFWIEESWGPVNKKTTSTWIPQAWIYRDPCTVSFTATCGDDSTESFSTKYYSGIITYKYADGENEYKIKVSLMAIPGRLYLAKHVYKNGELNNNAWHEIPTGAGLTLIEAETDIYPTQIPSTVCSGKGGVASVSHKHKAHVCKKSYTNTLLRDVISPIYKDPSYSTRYYPPFVYGETASFDVNYYIVDELSFDVAYKYDVGAGYRLEITNLSSNADIQVYANDTIVAEAFNSKTDLNVLSPDPLILHIKTPTVSTYSIYDYNDELKQVCPALNETTTSASPTEVKILFIDAQTGALLSNVNFSITGEDFSDSGVYDYTVSYDDTQLKVGYSYSYTASRDGYQSVSGSFTFQGGQVINLYFVPSKESFEDEMDDPVNNTVLTFTVIDSETKEPVEGAYITVNSETKITNSNGFTWFEVPKNNSYTYTVSAQNYFSVSGSVAVGGNQTDVTVELMPISVIPTTTTTGSTSSESLTKGINELYSAAPSLIQLAILVAMMSMLGMLMRTIRRR